MRAHETDLLASVLDQTEAIVSAVRPDQAHLPTPCPELDVTHLTDHLVGWARSFAARLTGTADTGDPNAYRAGPVPSTEFGAAARSIVRSYRETTEASRALPAGFLIMEFLTHGWDLAMATGHSVAYDQEAAEWGLATGRQMLKPEYRGPGQPFGPEVTVADAAGPVVRLVAFLGRDPAWSPSSR